MPAPKKVDRPVFKNLSLPTSLVVRVDLELFSEVEGRVPAGAWQRLVTRLLEDHLNKLKGTSNG